MARPIEFDREEVLQNAMLLFWRKGYNRTSMRELTEETRLQPGSLYGAFSSKRHLFILALESYADALKAFVGEVFGSDRPPLERIEAFFTAILEDSRKDRDRKGCLLINTLLETPAKDKELIRCAANALATLESAFKKALDEAQARGELAPERDTEALARLLMANIYGLRVYLKMGRSHKALVQIAETLLECTLH